MSAGSSSFAKKVMDRMFRDLAKSYVAIHRPTVIAVGGSIGKTSTKLMLAELLKPFVRVSYMDDSYNSGLGLYMSVFQLKVPASSSALSWLAKLLQALWRLVTAHYDVLIIEYGIDNVGEMEDMVSFIRPDISILTAVAPEHMEFLKDIDTVGKEEVKILKAAKHVAIVNAVDVNEKYLSGITPKLLRYGDADGDSSFNIIEWSSPGPTVEFNVGGKLLQVNDMHIISKPLIRQMSGALLAAASLGIDISSLGGVIRNTHPASGRMNLLGAVNSSSVIDDTANFSPVAGVAALDTLKRISATRRIALLGNMHELGSSAREGYEQVAAEFRGVDILVLVGDLSQEWFKPLAEKQGFVMNKNLFVKSDAIVAGNWLRDEVLQPDDLLLVKGPFGGWYLEEAVRIVLRDPRDAKLLTRQSDFWYKKKAKHFGDLYIESFMDK